MKLELPKIGSVVEGKGGYRLLIKKFNLIKNIYHMDWQTIKHLPAPYNIGKPEFGSTKISFYKIISAPECLWKRVLK